jgi:DNA-binding NtrC family response regulator
MKSRVLVVDDEASLCSLLEVFFERRGFAVDKAHSLRSAMQVLEKPEPALAMVDLSLGQDSGLELLKSLMTRFPQLPVIVMTAYGTVEKAVEAIKLGAFDFIQKPFEMVFLAKVVDKALATRALESENHELKEKLRRKVTIELIGQSEPMVRLKGLIDAVASSESTVLITGESGTGKEVVAKLIHQKSLRAEKPFVAVNCSALSESLLESELFGHVKGSFTSAYADKVGLFQVAHGGTLFLDEIGDMPLKTQVKLLRVLQEKEITPVGGTESRKIDVRLLAATNVDLESAVAQNRFREDLYYRLNVLRLHTPRLNERGDDSVLLANYFLQRKTGGRKSFSPEALASIAGSQWPGNVRQLENTVERAIAFASSDLIQSIEMETRAPHSGASSAAADHLDPAFSDSPLEAGAETTSLFGQSIPAGTAISPTLLDLEKAYIHWILSQNQWQKPKAARILGLDISTLYRKIEKYGLKPNS